VLEGLGEPHTAEALVEGTVAGIWRVMERDDGLGRVYFDLASQSAVEAPVRAIMAEMKAGFRAVLVELLGSLGGVPPPSRRGAIAVFLIAGIEGLALERLDSGETPDLSRARRIWTHSAAQAIAESPATGG
jgi:hypothetical protein